MPVKFTIALSSSGVIRICSLVFIASLVLLASAQSTSDLKRLQAIHDNPAQLSFNVSPLVAEVSRWIELKADFESAYPFELERVLAMIIDFEAAPKVFSRVEMAKLRSTDGTVSITEQRTGIHLLGMSFLSNLVFRYELDRKDPGRVILNFATIETDGSVLSTTGSWTFEQAGPGWTRVRYHIDTIAAPRLPAQEAVMGMFGAGDVSQVLKELGKALDRSQRG